MAKIYILGLLISISNQASPLCVVCDVYFWLDCIVLTRICLDYSKNSCVIFLAGIPFFALTTFYENYFVDVTLNI